ncbi:MAG: prepilin-type N-terminal cleavage/methylation domain-containing protein [Magnetococcales bacterium]|nr:prepilin-type N-terminal cleavage/methylation domain-containing protein [Magnetococcales bacterium]
MKEKYKYQQGVTLIEMAVVVAIIGLLVGSGVMMSQSLIRGMHAKEIMTTIKDLSTASRYFKEKYHYLPGDLPAAKDDIADIPDGSTCDIDYDASGTADQRVIGNGLIDSATEEGCFFTHLALAGFISHDPSTPLRSRFGAIRITANSNVKASNSDVLLPADILNVIQFSALPWDIANEIDDTIDDGIFAVTAGDKTAGNIQVDVNSSTAGNQGPDSDMTNLIPFLAAPL